MVNHDGETIPIKRLQVRIPMEVHRNFQIACLKQGEDMTAVINSFINKYIDYSNKKGTKK